MPLDSTYVFERGETGRYLGPPGLPAPASGAPEAVLQPYDNVLICGSRDGSCSGWWRSRARSDTRAATRSITRSERLVT